MPDYPKEQLQDLYKNLPKDLQEALYSQQSANNIQEICSKNGVTDEDEIYDVSKNVGYVLLGLLPPNEFQDVLEKELEIERDKAKQISWQITRFIFLPVKKSLEALYKIEIKAEAEALGTETLSPKKGSGGQDKYRETIK